MDSVLHRTLAELGIKVDQSVKMTPARAAKIRKIAMGKCGCFLCRNAIIPHHTFAEWEALKTATEAHNASLGSA